jgi:hypothetical protein
MKKDEKWSSVSSRSKVGGYVTNSRPDFEPEDSHFVITGNRKMLNDVIHNAQCTIHTGMRVV